jgi:hypothetical protein
MNGNRLQQRKHNVEYLYKGVEIVSWAILSNQWNCMEMKSHQSPKFYYTRILTTVFTRAQHWSQSWIIWIQTIPLQPIYHRPFQYCDITPESWGLWAEKHRRNNCCWTSAIWNTFPWQWVLRYESRSGIQETTKESEIQRLVRDSLSRRSSMCELLWSTVIVKKCQ